MVKNINKYEIKANRYAKNKINSSILILKLYQRKRNKITIFKKTLSFRCMSRDPQVKYVCEYVESAKLRASRAHFLTRLAWLRAHVSTQRALRDNVLTWQRALRAYVLTCQRVLRAYVLTYQRALRAYVITCRHVLRAYVLMCQCVLRALRPYVLSCCNSNNKNKFLITCFP